ncbi:hypothetical protein F5Y18DRAFT_270125 [Xylariaceae sp. FL1019]|nr:hypothetical protein F5Y18DRAFT_270125 [Xylariaceae sp. FL1019]
MTRQWGWGRPTERTPLQQSIAASIEITNAQLSYRHGDTVTGIVKKTHIEQAPEAVTATIKFICRVRTKVETESKNSDGSTSTSYHHGETTLFEISQTLFQGSARYGANVWPFSIIIPTATSSLSDQIPPATLDTLPPSHYSLGENISFAKRSFVLVEYVLEATVFGAFPKQPPAVATFPLHVQQRSTEGHITDFGINIVSRYQTVRTLHLDPEIAEKRLTLRQHMKTVFQPSSIPSYSYSMVIEHPSLLQLDHPSPLMFRISVLPHLAPQRPTGIPVGKAPVLTLVAAKLLLGSKRVVDGLEGNSRYVRDRTESSYWQEGTLFDWKEWPNTDQPLIIPDGTNHTGAKGMPLDMGARLQLRLTSRELFMGKQFWPVDIPVQPSFASRHIEQFHQLRWKLVVKCAGKTTKIAGCAPVRVLGPSESLEHARAMSMGEDGVHLAYRAWHAHEAASPALAQDATHLADIPPPQYPALQDGGESVAKPFKS